MFSKKATKIDEISTLNFIIMLHNFKSEKEILLLFVAYLENVQTFGLPINKFSELQINKFLYLNLKYFYPDIYHPQELKMTTYADFHDIKVKSNFFDNDVFQV